MTTEQKTIGVLTQTMTTETLEQELQNLSNQIATDQSRFQQVREELKRRRETRDEQPTPLTAEQRTENRKNYERKLEESLVLKVTAMEAEQARLVVEAEAAKAAQRDAEERLALVSKHLGTAVLKVAREELTAALFDVPPGGASGDAPAWIIRLHRAACAVAGMQVVAKSDPDALDLISSDAVDEAQKKLL